MVITQNERAPLLDYIAGAEEDGVRCGIHYEKRTRTYFATIHGMENTARELNFLLPYLRTNKKFRQVMKFRKYLRTRRKRHQHQARRALDILDGT